ncbi:MAG: hypothetical protein GXZ04_06195 [Clostridiales bacterium]|nr:hypothetical protein [Clostridiales bacterium]
MICKSCNQESNTASRMCPFCGQYMGAEPEPMADDHEASADLTDARVHLYKTVPGNKRVLKKTRRKRNKRRSRKSKNPTYQGGMINWLKVAVVVMALMMAAGIGVLIWLQVSPSGQLVKARMGRTASSDAYWTLGTELLDQGYISRSIETYKTAETIEPERKDLDEKLLLLAEAYEAANQTIDAEAVYQRIYTQLAPKKPEAYRLAINILLDQDRIFEAVTLMQLAYDQTGDEGFFNQRSQLVPQPPKASLAAGKHMYSKDISFISPQDYDIYYTTGDGLLPETGIKYTGTIRITEGTYHFRAVCVSSELVSDEMSVRYTITLPTPMAPKANMQPKTYERQIRVSLRIVDEEDKDVTLYYTLDGTKPDLDSPRYDGEPILIPPGKSLLRAIAVNRYGKISSEMILEYKVNRPYKSFFRSEKDQFAGFTLMKTTRDAFIAQYGEPQSEAPVLNESVPGPATRAVYPWGEARFTQSEEGIVVYHVTTNLASMKGPRNTAIGMVMKEVTDKFTDKGQPPNDRGDRGIYFDIKDGYANYKIASDDPNTGILQYVYVGSADASTTILLYDIVDGKVAGITMRYLNYRKSMVEL